MLRQAFEYRVKGGAVTYIAGRGLRFRHISMHSISIACLCSASFFSFSITVSMISEKTAQCDLF